MFSSITYGWLLAAPVESGGKNGVIARSWILSFLKDGHVDMSASFDRAGHASDGPDGAVDEQFKLSVTDWSSSAT
jgi:hypothetical protein